MSHLGVIGLGTMGANLARNAARSGATVAVFNRTAEKTDQFMKDFGKEGSFIACHSLQELCNSLPKPRAILLMVKAGGAVDQMIADLLPFLEKGDILIDGGNSHYRDTERRQRSLEEKGIRFIGMGISGGEEGALNGPSMMPGGDRDAVTDILPLLKKMAADDEEGGKCVTFIGEGGAGHFVKMVHNGIEYGVMQLIAESFAILRSLGVEGDELAETFERWNTGDLQSYLMEITGKVLRKKDPATGDFLVDLIKDEAGQKGTGRWAVEAALLYGLPIPTIAAAVEARMISARWEERQERSKIFLYEGMSTMMSCKELLKNLHVALELSVILAYVQGFDLLGAATTTEHWNLPISEIARIWSGGCIIRSALLPLFQKAFRNKVKETCIIDRFRGEKQRAWRTLMQYAVGKGIAVPALSSSLAYYDAVRSARLPQNLIQAQRDFFGAHGFERLDKPGTFHL